MPADMPDDLIPEPHDLPNKPLGEVIFELRWALTPKAEGRESDPGFRILVGRYYDRLHNDYPHIENLPVSQVPEDMTPYIVHHQLRPAKDGWPLTQVGPGVITVNDSEGYTWQGFRRRVSRAVEALFESYPMEIQQLDPVRVQLTYINALLFDTTHDSLTQFLRDNLHVTVAIDPKLFQESKRVEKPIGFDLNVSFSLDEPQGVGTVRFSTGTKKQQPALIWQIIIQSSANRAQVPKTPQDLQRWEDDANAVVD